MSQEQPFLQQIRNTANVTLDVILAGLSANITSAFNQANTAVSDAGTALTVAEEAFSQANTAISDAGTALTVAEEAFSQANAAGSLAGTALNVAEQAFNTANVGISVSGITPGTYGAPNLALAITVDARGRVLSIGQATPTLFSPTGPGIVPASGGGSSNFLRADGAWAAPIAALAAAFGANGSMTLATTSGDILVQWGQRAITAGGSSGPFTFNFNQSFSGQAWVVLPTMVGGEISCALNTRSASQFSIFTSFASTNSTAMQFIAIGPA
jgi:hypothetical protein